MGGRGAAGIPWVCCTSEGHRPVVRVARQPERLRRTPSLRGARSVARVAVAGYTFNETGPDVDPTSTARRHTPYIWPVRITASIHSPSRLPYVGPLWPAVASVSFVVACVWVCAVLL